MDVRDSTRAAAIAPDKTALLPGQVATFANYTIYDKGINGVMVDVANLPAVGVSAADFTFTAGTSSTPGSWAAAPGAVERLLKLESELAKDPAAAARAGHLQIVAKKPQGTA